MLTPRISSNAGLACGRLGSVRHRHAEWPRTRSRAQHRPPGCRQLCHRLPDPDWGVPATQASAPQLHTKGTTCASPKDPLPTGSWILEANASPALAKTKNTKQTTVPPTGSSPGERLAQHHFQGVAGAGDGGGTREPTVPRRKVQRWQREGTRGTSVPGLASERAASGPTVGRRRGARQPRPGPALAHVPHTSRLWLSQRSHHTAP